MSKKPDKDVRVLGKEEELMVKYSGACKRNMENYNYVTVSRTQFDAFLDKYPRKLIQDLYMDMYSFYDFSLNEAPCQESQVATIYYGEFCIREDILKEFENE